MADVTQDILPIIKALAVGNPMLEKLDKFLDQEVVKSIISKGFPVRIVIPMNMSIRANITFKVCKKIKASSLPANHFELPSK